MAKAAQLGIPPSVRRSEIVLAREERGTPVFTFAIETSIHPLPRALSVADLHASWVPSCGTSGSLRDMTGDTRPSGERRPAMPSGLPLGICWMLFRRLRVIVHVTWRHSMVIEPWLLCRCSVAKAGQMTLSLPQTVILAWIDTVSSLQFVNFVQSASSTIPQSREEGLL